MRQRSDRVVDVWVCVFRVPNPVPRATEPVHFFVVLQPDLVHGLVVVLVPSELESPLHTRTRCTATCERARQSTAFSCSCGLRIERKPRKRTVRRERRNPLRDESLGGRELVGVLADQRVVQILFN